MKKTKKALIATTMAGVMAVGAGFGTYSWFTAGASSSEGSVEAGTLQLNNLEEYTVFNAENIEPIDPELSPELINEGDTITVENTGTLDMIPRFQLDLEFASDIGTSPEDLKEHYMITMNFERNDMDWSEEITMSAADFESRDFIDPEWFPSEDGFIYDLGSGDSFDVSFDIYLDSEAGNEYQGSSVTGTLEVEGKQTVEGADWEE